MDDEETKRLNAYYNRAKAHAKPEITVTEGEWTATQVYAFERGMYGTWYHKNGEFRSHALGKYRTEEQLREELRGMDAFMDMLESRREITNEKRNAID